MNVIVKHAAGHSNQRCLNRPADNKAGGSINAAIVASLKP